MVCSGTWWLTGATTQQDRRSDARHRFIWLEDTIEKLKRKHGVHEEEVVEVFQNRPHIRFSERGHRPGEDLYTALGQTDGGRHLSIFFILKDDKKALVISARRMTPRERKRYERT